MSSNDKTVCYCWTDSLNTFYSVISDICVFAASPVTQFPSNKLVKRGGLFFQGTLEIYIAHSFGSLHKH